MTLSILSLCHALVPLVLAVNYVEAPFKSLTRNGNSRSFFHRKRQALGTPVWEWPDKATFATGRAEAVSTRKNG